MPTITGILLPLEAALERQRGAGIGKTGSQRVGEGDRHALYARDRLDDESPEELSRRDTRLAEIHRPRRDLEVTAPTEAKESAKVRSKPRLKTTTNGISRIRSRAS